jgi:hypothetical protein
MAMSYARAGDLATQARENGAIARLLMQRRIRRATLAHICFGKVPRLFSFVAPEDAEALIPTSTVMRRLDPRTQLRRALRI